MSEIVPTCREDVTKRILQHKVVLQKKWRDLAEQLNQSVEWTVAACLGQMQMNLEQSQAVAAYFQLNAQECLWLQTIPHKNTLNGGTVPSDPLLYRLHEALGVYGPALKEIIHEEFGDGIVSAIDFSIKVERESDPAGDRCRLVWSGKFLPYKKF
ncbi:cyanate hydratase-like [Sitodiplosis mosellana]|uniref:cyanate hydratase-like n=1 Tax=Sitodiplosis mosellana TaxID=263140 RepID=UPI002444260B|nr:cyanate hydratase-like [Sitodiplosis mosellana]XP_055310099.1 cyanate hydratase-like [Sitodiplosis mosellana]XP_055310100.1 cyanate hydratase-like [Sitodiplosis mosellana]